MQTSPQSSKRLIDDEILAISLQLYLLQTDEAIGKLPSTSDRAVAIQAYRDLLTSERTTLNDEKMAKSIEVAVTLDEEVLREFVQIDEQERADREMALRLSGRAVPGRRDSNAPFRINEERNVPVAGPSTARVKSSIIAFRSNNQGRQAALQEVPKEKHECIVCLVEGSDYKKVPSPCTHHYCSPCLKTHCEMTLRDRSLIPLKCCESALPDDWIKEALTEDQYAKYASFREENLITVGETIVDPEFSKTVTQLGWKICKRCAVGVERTFGCNHITCKCGYEFCYRCGAGWEPRECLCDLYSATELEQHIDRIAPNVVNRAERDRLRNLFQNHDQHVHTWDRHQIYSRPYRQCRNCNWYCNKWYFQCNSCYEIACQMCRYNRRRY